jgi:nitrogen fixation protein NifB
MNACDPEIGAKIYSMVSYNGKRYDGIEGATILMQRQTEGIKLCVDLGMVVKVNIVMIPGINSEHIPELVRYVKGLGVYIVNILPLIPVEGTPFENVRAPTPLERRDLMDRCSLDAKMMRHCRQCRADAIGLLGEDRSQEFVHIGGCSRRGDGCGPSSAPIIPLESPRTHIAIASNGGSHVDAGFGNAHTFHIYAISSGSPELVRRVNVNLDRSVYGSDHRKHIEAIVDSLKDCNTVVVKEIGHLPSKILENIGIRVIISNGLIEDIARSSFD